MGCFKKDNNDSCNTIMKLILILGSIAAILLAFTVIYKKYNKCLKGSKSSTFNFEDDDFCDDCDYCGDCSECDADIEDDQDITPDDIDFDQEATEV